jgi:aspartyl-tRNA(Asn)/glutamyl-tRNA(Gln) amidotransferase subunit A
VLPATITAARAQLAAGRISAEELVEGTLARIDERNPELNAYLHVDREAALAVARAQDRAPSSGPLAGIPLCVKDIIDVDGMPTTAGAQAWQRFPAGDAEAVRR